MFDGQPNRVLIYVQADGKCPFEVWLRRLADQRAVARIDARVTRLEAGAPGDYRSVGAGVYELRIDYGPGYRVYFGVSGRHVVLLLCGGAKATQARDIERAHAFWKEYKEGL